jgi:hypothetical protein
MRAAIVALILAPLLAVPAYLVGNLIAAALDHNDGDGVFALGQLLGLVLPGILSIVVARWSGSLRWPLVIVFGAASSALGLVVLFLAFVAACSATQCGS